MTDPPIHTREVPVAGVPHPLADQVGVTADGARYVLTETRARVVLVTPGRTNLVNQVAAAGRRVVLASDELSRLSACFADLWREAGGSWLVRDAKGGMRDGFTGRRLDRVDDLWAPGPVRALDDLALRFLRPDPADAVELLALTSARHPARSGLRLGGPTAALAEAGVGEPPWAFGPYEPVGQDWDPDRLTEAIRSQLPRESQVLVAGSRLAGTLSAQRTEHGVEEYSRTHLALPARTEAAYAAARDRLVEAYAGLARTGMPQAGLVMARPGRSDLRLPPFLTAPWMPVLLLVGAPAVRSFGLSPEALRERFDARVVGRPRLPALLFDLGDRGEQAWARLDAVLDVLGTDILAGALGPAGARVLQRPATEKPPTAEGEPDAR